MGSQDHEIRFYSTKGEYGYMSNFYKSPITISGVQWPTTEHYFQAKKFTDTDLQNKIRLVSSASKAAKMGRTKHHSFREDWDTHRLKVMKLALKAKFYQHQDLKEKLLATGNATLIEDSPVDYFWGIGKDGSGENMLGIQLMEVREWLKTL